MKLSSDTLSKASVEVGDSEPWKRTFQISLPSAEFQRLRAVYIRGFGRDMRVPGFRKGKVPAEIVLQRAGNDLSAGFLQELAAAFVERHAHEQRWALTRTPRVVASSESGDRTVLTVEVEMTPKFDLPQYRGLPARIEHHPVTDLDVKQFVSRTTEEMSTFHPKEGPLVVGDAARVSLQRTTSTGLALVGEGTADLTILLADEETPDELMKALVGRAKGDSTRVTLPSDSSRLVHQAPSADEGETYVLTIRETFTVEPPDPKTLARRFGIEDPSELPTRVRVLLEDMRDGESRAQMRAELVSRITRSAVIHLPPSLVEERLEETRLSLLNDARSKGQDPPNGLLDPQFFAERHREEIRQRLKELLVVEAIAVEAGLHPTTEQLDSAVDARARMAGISRKEMLRRLGEDGVAALARRLTRDNVERFLEDEADVELADTR